MNLQTLLPDSGMGVWVQDAFNKGAYPYGTRVCKRVGGQIGTVVNYKNGKLHIEPEGSPKGTIIAVSPDELTLATTGKSESRAGSVIRAPSPSVSVGNDFFFQQPTITHSTMISNYRHISPERTHGVRNFYSPQRQQESQVFQVQQLHRTESTTEHGERTTEFVDAQQTFLRPAKTAPLPIFPSVPSVPSAAHNSPPADLSPSVTSTKGRSQSPLSPSTSIISMKLQRPKPPPKPTCHDVFSQVSNGIPSKPEMKSFSCQVTAAPPPPPPPTPPRKIIERVEVQVPVEKLVEVPIDRVIEKIVEVPIEKIVEKIIEIPVERIVEKIIEIPVEKIVQKIVEIPVEKIVIKHIEVPVERVVEKIVEIEKEVPRIINVEKIIEVPVEKIVEIPKIIQIEKEIPVEKIIRVPVEVEVEKIVETIKEVPIDKIIEIEKEIEIEVIKEVKVIDEDQVNLLKSQLSDKDDEIKNLQRILGSLTKDVRQLIAEKDADVECLNQKVIKLEMVRDALTSELRRERAESSDIKPELLSRINDLEERHDLDNKRLYARAREVAKLTSEIDLLRDELAKGPTVVEVERRIPFEIIRETIVEKRPTTPCMRPVLSPTRKIDDPTQTKPLFHNALTP